MKKLVERVYNKGIVESYKQNVDKNGPILGSFEVKGLIQENTISQNRTFYPTEAWKQPTALGRGGKYLDENGKLRPSTLFGSTDHPADGHAEFYLSESAICWSDLKRNSDGTWDGKADILNTPSGKIVDVVLDYAKIRGGGDMLGVSTRSLAETSLTESLDSSYEAVIPDGFELMTIDFVYNPSFKNKAARTESTKVAQKSLFESIRNLAKFDKDNAKVYEEVAAKLEEEAGAKVVKKYTVESKSVADAKAAYLKELKDSENRLHNAIYELEKMTDEEFTKAGYEGSRQAAIEKVKAEHSEVQAEIMIIENPEPQETITESKDLDKTLEELGGEDTPDGEEDPEEETDPEETPEEETDPEEEVPAEGDLQKQVNEIKDMLQKILDLLMPIDSPEQPIGEEELPIEETDPEEETEDEFDLTEEEVEAMDAEELEYLLKNSEK